MKMHRQQFFPFVDIKSSSFLIHLVPNFHIAISNEYMKSPVADPRFPRRRRATLRGRQPIIKPVWLPLWPVYQMKQFSLVKLCQNPTISCTSRSNLHILIKNELEARRPSFAWSWCRQKAISALVKSEKYLALGEFVMVGHTLKM